MNFVISMLRDVPDPRTGDATRHSLLDVLTIALVASICGCESCVEFADFAEDREDLLREFLDLSNGLPSHDTFSRLFHLLDPDALSRCFGRFLDHVGTDGAGVLAEVEAFFATADALAWHETADADHGRVERRRHATTQDVAWLFSDRRYAGEPAMPGLTTIAVVDSTVERDGQASRSRRYYLSSACLAPERLAAAVRARWSIENSQLRLPRFGYCWRMGEFEGARCGLPVRRRVRRRPGVRHVAASRLGPGRSGRDGSGGARRLPARDRVSPAP